MEGAPEQFRNRRSTAVLVAQLVAELGDARADAVAALEYALRELGTTAGRAAFASALQAAAVPSSTTADELALQVRIALASMPNDT